MSTIDELRDALIYVRTTRNNVDDCKFNATVVERAGMARALRMVERHIEDLMAKRGAQKSLSEAA